MYSKQAIILIKVISSKLGRVVSTFHEEFHWMMDIILISDLGRWLMDFNNKTENWKPPVFLGTLGHRGIKRSMRFEPDGRREAIFEETFFRSSYTERKHKVKELYPDARFTNAGKEKRIVSRNYNLPSVCISSRTIKAQSLITIQCNFLLVWPKI